MRSLQELLQHIRLSRFSKEGQVGAPAKQGSDLLARLPIELHILLLDYFNADDIVAALKSSRTLRIVWLSDDVWPWLADRWYPGLSQAVRVETAERDVCAMGNKQQGSRTTATDPGELFRQTLGKLCRRVGGRYGSALHHQMQLLEDPIFSLSKNVPPDQGGVASMNELDEHLLQSTKFNVSRFMLYNNGRIAWWPNSYSAPYIAIVDDFKKATRRMYRFPDHDGVQQGYKTAMSDELLVIAKETSLHAWHFDKNLLCSVVIPEQLERCVAEGSDVLIITRSAELYQWRFGWPVQRVCPSGVACYQPGPVRMGGLVEAPLQSHSPLFHIPRRQGLVLKDSGMLLDFILHPYLRDILFIVTMYEGELVVHENHDGKLVQSYPFHSGTTSMVGQWKKINEYLRWKRCDSYGGYCLFSVYLGVDSELSPSDLQGSDRPFCTCGQKTGLVSVCFNIYTKAFTVTCHHFLHSHDLRVDPVPAAFHLWHNQLYTSYAPEVMQAGMPITALRCCLAVQERRYDVSDTPVFTISASSQGLLARRHRYFPEQLSDLPESPAQRDHWRRQVDFGLDITARCASDSVRSYVSTLWKWDAPNVHRPKIVGDDDFLMYVVDGVYTAWSFGDEIPPPKEAVKWMRWNRT